MNITELRYLVAIMECGSVSAAAKRLYAAQPNVSKALKNLEEEYHLRIFERSSTGMIPTEQGRHFIEQAERVLREVDRLDQSVQEAQERCAELRVMIPTPPTPPMRRWIIWSGQHPLSGSTSISGRAAPWSAGSCPAAGVSSGSAAVCRGG